MLCWKVHVKSKIHWKSLEMGEHNSYLMLSAQRHHRNVDSSTMCTFLFFHSRLRLKWLRHTFTEKKRLHKSIILSWMCCIRRQTNTHREREREFILKLLSLCHRPSDFSKHSMCHTDPLRSTLYENRDKRIANTNKMSNKWNWWWCEFYFARHSHTKNCMNIAWI